ncbi:serine/threonine-protein kinase TAO3-like isoform X3 [Styela clava]
MAPDKATASKAGSLKDPDIASLFFNIDPEKLFDDLREIGHGSFGAVYYARNVDTNEVVAIKKMSYSGKQSLEKWQDIIKEVKFLTQIKHPNTVDYKGCYLKEHTAWLVMEYCIGSASDLVEVHKNSLKEDEIAGIIHDAMQGLHYLHLHDKIHRDVKAGNILLTDGGHVKLADFGSASIVSPANSFVGTPYWMAPEVILAMDEGQYSGKADIWSMGITCIELAERKPPLFNMNAMSALYHIAQNDPPTLSESLPDGDKEVPTNWSQDFIKFVSLLLQKIPEDRPTSDGVLQHTFLTKERSPTCVLDLIERTKNVVRDLDNLQYRKMKKILMAENRVKDSPPSQQHPISSTAASQKADTTDDDMDSVSCTDSIASNPSSFISVASSSKSSSISSLNESRVSDSGSLNSQDGTTAAISEEQGASSSAATATIDNRPQRSYSPSGGRTTSPIVTRQQQESQLARIAGIQSPGARSRLKPQMQQKTQRERQSDVYNFRNSLTPESIKRRDELMKNDSGFATIRSAQVVHRQMYEHNEDNRHREQMLGYKRMRQQHQKQLINFEQKLKNEMDEYSVKLVKELESTRSAFAQELDRLVRKHQQELEKEAKQQQGDDKKYQKHIGQMQDQEIKGFLQQQKKDYKGKKEQLKEDSNQMQGNKEARDEWLTRQINTLVTMHSQAENQLRERYNQTLELEVRKYRRKALLSRHNLEQDLLREELNLKQQHKDKEHEMLLRQHDATQSLEYKHLHAIHTQRIEHLKSQHQTELSNQMEYSQRRESELKRKHLAAIRQQPKSLKLKENQIKKQFHETVKIQEKQYKAWRNHVLESVPKKEQKEVLRRMKEEQMRKLALLGEQYERSITDLNQKQSVKLSDGQEKERGQLQMQLQQELELLTAYQSKVKKVMEQQHEKELKDLEQKVSLRRAMLEQKMEEDSVKLQNERRERIRSLLEQQGGEIENFDAESLRMGFSTVVITNYGDHVFVDPHVQSGTQGSAPGNLHVSASTSAIGKSGPHGGMPRSSSGTSIRSVGAVGQGPGLSHPSQPYSHKAGRSSSDAPTRGGTSQGHSYQRLDSSNSNRNNSSRIMTGSPVMQRRVLESDMNASTGRNNPNMDRVMSQSSRSTPQPDDNSIVQRLMAANRPSSRGPPSEASSSGMQQISGMSHHGSTTSLPASSGYMNSRHARSGRSWDGADRTGSWSARQEQQRYLNSHDSPLPVRTQNRGERSSHQSSRQIHSRIQISGDRLVSDRRSESPSRNKQTGGVSGTSFSSSFH